jgi:hypothetical protein
MAVITASTFGEMSGRVGPLVFSRNNGKQYVRQYVVGTDASSLQQLTSRQRFSVMAAHWRTLSVSQKSAWKTFANTLFVAKHPKANAVHSGYTAFVSLNTMLATCYSTDYNGIITVPGVDATYTPFPPVNYEAPTSAFSANIQNSTGGALQLVLSDAVFDSTSNLCVVTLNLCPVNQVNPIVFKTPVINTNIGFACYFSMPFSGGRTTVNSKEAYLMGTLKNPIINSGWATASQISFSWTVSSTYLNKLKYAFTIGKHIFVSIYSVGFSGQTAFIGRLLITIL